MTILRFLGTSPESSTIIPLLKGLCYQITANYGENDHKEDIYPEDISPLIQIFKNKLMLATKEKPLIIFMDSLDQLSPANGAYTLGWLPSLLPSNVKIVLSAAILEDNIIMDNLHRVIQTMANFQEVFQLGESLGVSILITWLENNKRTLTEKQWQIIKPALVKCNLPLYIKLVFDDIVNWKSYTPKADTVLYDSVHTSIMSLFNKLEKQHGPELVSRALMYLTASKNGLSENELEDLLSLDDIVLNDVYQYHRPPVRRIPPLLWTRIRSDIPNYLTKREADGVNVIDWYHRQFQETALKKYFISANTVHKIHSALADYFLGIWGDKPKPFEYTELQRQKFNLPTTAGIEDRFVPDQPHFYTDADENILHYNLRKFSELPYHLVRCKRFDDLYVEVLFNFKWLHAKLSCMSLSSIVGDYDYALDHKDDREVKLVVDALKLGAYHLQNYPNMIGPQLIARLLPYYEQHTKIRRLLQQCDKDGIKVNALVPVHHCQHTPGGPLQFSLEGHPRAVFAMVLSSDGTQLVTVSSILLAWDVTTGEKVKHIDPKINGVIRYLSLDHNYKIAACCANTNQLIIFYLMAEDAEVIDNPVDGTDMITGTAVDNNFIYAITNSYVYMYDHRGQRTQKYGLLDDER